jgi:hypothetical protein
MNQQITFIDVDKLHFDPLNPRIPSSSIDSSDENAVINWMLTDASIIELMGSIGEKGFFPAEPLLVVPIEGMDGHFYVVEGNRRLSAVKLLLHPEFADKRSKSVELVANDAKHKPNSLPAFIYNQRQDILDYLGFKHITGVKSWSALAKARYLESLRSAYTDVPIDDQYRALAKAIGSRSDYVQQLLNGLAVFRIIKENDYFDVRGLNEATIDFGVYYNALRWSNIREYLNVDVVSEAPTSQLNISNLQNLVEWVSLKNSENKTRLGESRNLGKLNKILGSPKAYDAFTSGTPINQAFLLTDEPNSIFAKSINNSLSEVQVANNYIHLVTEWTDTESNNLKEIKSIASNMRVLLVTKEIEDED